MTTSKNSCWKKEELIFIILTLRTPETVLFLVPGGTLFIHWYSISKLLKRIRRFSRTFLMIIKHKYSPILFSLQWVTLKMLKGMKNGWGMELIILHLLKKNWVMRTRSKKCIQGCFKVTLKPSWYWKVSIRKEGCTGLWSQIKSHTSTIMRCHQL